MGRATTRIFFFLVAVAMPPLIAFAAVDTLAGDLVTSVGMGTALLVAAAVTVVWAAVVAVGASRILGGEARSMVELAERGASGTPPDPNAVPGEAQRRLAAALDERNRQIAELAARSRSAPISLDAPAVARSMVEAIRGITGDPTWTLVVMRTEDPQTLASGVYGSADGDITGLGEVHKWATTLDAEDEEAAVQHADGPWGAFVVANVAASDEVHAALIAPWEGRQPPSGSERELLGLVGQHAGMAIEHALLYARVSRQAEELDRLARLQSDFLRGVSHDLQTPLTSIRALAEEAQSAPSMPPQALGDLDAIAHQADRLRRMVGQLLAMSRLESGVLTPRSDVFGVGPVIERTWGALRADRPFELTIKGEPHLAIGDPDRFEQALWALLDNALKYSPPGTPIGVEVAASGGAMTVSVSDRGAGMDGETRERAFEQFYRSPAARHAVPDGSGIGLYTARGLLRAMGGDIQVLTGGTTGSTVVMRLPAEPAGSA